MIVDTIECIKTCQAISLILWYWKNNFIIYYSAFRKEGQNWVFSLQTLRFNHFWIVIAFCFKFLWKCRVPHILQFLYSHFYFFFTQACAMALWLQMSLSLAQFCDSLWTNEIEAWLCISDFSSPSHVHEFLCIYLEIWAGHDMTMKLLMQVHLHL
jgi:hypothetical protein